MNENITSELSASDDKSFIIDVNKNTTSDRRELFDRIIKWNESRDNSNFNHILETKMLAEELFEFCGFNREDSKYFGKVFANLFSGHYLKTTIINDIEGIADPSDQKSQPGITLIPESGAERPIAYSDLVDAIGDIIFIAIGTIYKLGYDPVDVLTIICDHNDTKGSLKDADGKIIKDESFVEPEY